MWQAKHVTEARVSNSSKDNGAVLPAGKRPGALMNCTRVWTTKWRWPVFRSAAPRTEIGLVAGRQAGGRAAEVQYRGREADSSR